MDLVQAQKNVTYGVITCFSLLYFDYIMLLIFFIVNQS